MAEIPILPQNPAELVSFLNRFHGENENSSAKQKEYRYVIYARKSTEDKNKQVRSLADQIAECQELAERYHLRVNPKDIIQESASAKESDIRPRFKEMIEGLKTGKYDGVITWHPDRLARNIKDAGEIIDLLDKHIIKDLKFVSFSFENTTSGKMLLGITFVMSKEYSDKLSDDIMRGNQRSADEGKYINRTKHGYFKDSNQQLRPDGDNFTLIQNAFRLRVEGKALKEVAEYLNKHGYQRMTPNGTHVLFPMNFKRVESFVKDPSYTGVMRYGKKGKAIDLTEKYDFTPALSVPDFMKINKLISSSQFMRLAKRYRRDEDVKANLLRGMVVCAECNEPMSAGITPKKNAKKGITRYFFYRCDTEDCPRHNKSVRAKVVVSYVREFLEKKPFSSKPAYEHYEQEMERVATERIKEIRTLLTAQKTKKARREINLADMKAVLATEKDERIKASYREDIKKAIEEIDAVEAEIARLEALSVAGKTAILTYAQFLELMEKTPKILASIKQMKELDYIIRKIFSNFAIRDKKVIKSALIAPFDALCDPKLSDCGDGRSRTAVQRC